ncbi:serine hydrolase domain-containing protein [Streptomyces celluloflavus]|uniref:serine hydrolase domain-containing protein n=1 Tax=Streptomyces celluloflavus TaxID=58344 RepID=UPI0036D7D177
MYASVIGEVDGVRLLTPETLASATREQADGKDQVLVAPSRFSSGYQLPTEDNPMTGPDSFGHTGRGGSLGFADPEYGIAFGYMMNHVIGGADDVRASLLVDAGGGHWSNRTRVAIRPDRPRRTPRRTRPREPVTQ